MKGRVKISRFNPHTDRAPYFQSFEFDYAPPMTVLDVLNQVRENFAPDLGYDGCCRNGHCGLCGVKINGRFVAQTFNVNTIY